ncbi:peptidase [Dipodfec virus UOA04_Rod_582]|nr:peptidase [Dipodfec virus UOA04_Rod_582]
MFNFNRFVTPHFKASEFFVSANHPDLVDGCRSAFLKNVDYYFPRMCVLAYVLEILRSKCDFPLVITSGFRDQKLNSAVGGVSNSDHRKMLAVDISLSGLTDEQKLLLQGLVVRNLYSFFRYREIHDTYIHLSIHPHLFTILN